jgi:hypothetical protein
MWGVAQQHFFNTHTPVLSSRRLYYGNLFSSKDALFQVDVAAGEKSKPGSATFLRSNCEGSVCSA